MKAKDQDGREISIGARVLHQNCSGRGFKRIGIVEDVRRDDSLYGNFFALKLQWVQEDGSFYRLPDDRADLSPFTVSPRNVLVLP